jgi:hypothetical protein
LAFTADGGTIAAAYQGRVVLFRGARDEEVDLKGK